MESEGNNFKNFERGGKKAREQKKKKKKQMPTSYQQ